jgi:hypothetical protein
MKLRVLLAVCLLPLLAVSLLAQSQQPIFPLLGSYSTTLASGGVVGDFNGDGLPDLAYYRMSSPNPSVPVDLVTLLNQGGHNDPVVVTTSFSCGGSMTAADMNKDGKLDIVQTCNGYVIVLFGNGDGTFQIPSTTAYYSAIGPTVVSVSPPVDLNGDGYPDVVINSNATVSGGASYVTVFLNQGSSSPGTLFNPQSYAFPDNQTGTITGMGDVNGDGKQDVIVNSNSGPLAILLGKGDGTLQYTLPQTQSCSLATGSTAVGDFNNDGYADVACDLSQSLQVFLGSSSGSLTNGPTSPLPGLGSSTLAVIGKNGDNNLDLALSGTTILLGDGQGGFTVGQSIAVSGAIFPLPPDSNGKADLLINTGDSLTRLRSNGDGTFQGPPHLNTGGGFVTTDVNNDGLTDTLWIDSTGNLKTGLGRGNGTFTVSNSIPAPVNGIVVTGDINGDGKVDVVVLGPGNEAHAGSPAVPAQLISYLGDGSGTFGSKAGSGLQGYGVTNAVLGDFNGDGKLDLLFTYFGSVSTTVGVVFVPGNGDATFGNPVPLAQTASPTPSSPLFAGDLNNDGKLDFVWNGSVYLNNGAPTFRQIPLGIAFPAVPQALGDLNGDGKLDIVAGSNVYAGNGDGSFQTASLFTFAGGNAAVVIGDVNGDGNPDLLTAVPTVNQDYQLSVFLGSGNGSFVQDSNTYIYPTIRPFLSNAPFVGAAARLNNFAPAPPNDKTLDFIAFTYSGATSLLNQLNPAPGAAQRVPSRTTLYAFATSAGVNQQLTLTATVTGIAPTGNVTFRNGTTTLGTSAIANGTATLTTSFATVGSYSVTASYAGDSNNNVSTSGAVSIEVAVATAATTTALSASSSNANQGQAITYTATVTGKNPTGTVTFTSGSTTLATSNLTNGVATVSASFFAAAGTYSVTASYSGDANNNASTSSAVSITIVAPDFTLTTNPGSATVKAGQTATFAINMAAVGGYSGTVNLSCGTLPAGAACNFSNKALSGSATTSTLTITTTAPTAMLERPGSSSARIAVWAVLLGLCFSPKRVLRSRKHLARIMMALLLTMGSVLYLSGCGGSSSSTPTNPGTPTGTQAITVSGADSASGPSHNLNLQLIVQ